MVIEKNIKIPERESVHQVIKQLEVGDSLYFQNRKEMENKRVIAYYYDVKVSCRKMNNGWRLWRVK